MASTYSPNLRLELIGTGEQQGTWGTTTNTNLGTLLEEAIGGYVSVTVSNAGDTTLSTNNGAVDQSRNAVINLTGTITAARNVICPAIEKLYVVKNATTGGFSVTFKVSGQTGVTIPNGETYFLYVDGIDANKIVGNVASTNATNTFTENQIISVTDNTDAALRITQLGTGNALLVEDSTNPDATPTVVAADGTVVVGHTAALNTDNYVGTQITPKVQIQGTNNQASTLSATTWSDSTAGPQIALGKSRSATVGTNTVVQSGDILGAVTFAGDDGGEIIIAASIRAESDGTPGNDDMPGRLLFSTTADGAQTATERMRINSKGNVNIGSADDPDSALQITGSTNVTGIMVGSISGTTLTITAVTSGSVSVGDRLFIAASGLDYNTYVTALGTGTGGTGTYTINNTTTLASTTIYLYASSINTLSFVDTDTAELTNQPIGGIEWYGSDATTPGAGVKAYIATVAESASPDTALLFGTSDNTANTHAVERMRIASDGKVGIGTQAPDALLSVNGVASFGDGAEATPSIANFGDLNTGLWFPDADTISVSTGATERLRVRSDGGVGIGGVGSATGGVTVSKTATGGTTYNNISLNSQIQSDVTAIYRGVLSSVSTAASAFTTSTLQHFSANGVTLGAGSNVTTQYGFVAQSDLTAAGTNIGFYSGIPSAAGDWNFYAAGTAQNYFAGNVGIATTSPSNPLHVSGAAQATTFEVGNASDTTISRVSAGVIAVEGDTVAMLAADQTFSGLKTFTGGIQSTANAIYNVQNANAKTVADAAVALKSNQYISWTATSPAATISLGNQSTGSTGVLYDGYKARGGNTTTITAAASGDDILTIRAFIYDGAAWRASARIKFLVDAAVSSGDTPGAITFATTSDGAGSVTDRFKIDSSGDCLVIGTSLLGYGAGSGSSVTQATSRTTGVTINNPVGRITLVSAAGSTTWTSFTVTNSTVGTSDLIVVNQRTGTDLYEIHVTAVSAGSFRLSFRTTGGSTTETPTFSFAVISGSTT